MNSIRNDLVAVVTGGAAGLGQAFSQRLAELGAAVVIADIADASETLGLIEKAGGRGIGVRCDTSDESAVAELAARAHEAFGTVNVVVNNVAIYPSYSLLDTPPEVWDRVMSVNLRSNFLVARTFLPGMQELGWGRVVSITSAGFHAPPPNRAAYITTKGGVIGFTRALSAEVSDMGVTVNAIAPGLVPTQGTLAGEKLDFELYAGLQKIRRVEQPSDLTGALAFLVSDDSAFMTGQTLAIDGGFVHV